MFNYDIEDLSNRLHSLIGKRVWITESLSRNRHAGHDRHFATLSRFMMTIEHASWTISGSNFYLDGAGGFSYSISSEHIVYFDIDDKGHLIIVEQFESKTERKTELQAILNPPVE